MIDRKVLLEKMQQFGIDWIGSQGFLDEGQVKHVLDIVENESGLTERAADECPHCHAKPAYTDQQTYPDICSECGTRR